MGYRSSNAYSGKSNMLFILPEFSDMLIKKLMREL